MTKKYKSKIGPELYIPLSLLLGTVFFLMFTQGSPDWMGLVIISVVILFIVHLFATTCYTIEGDKLIVKSGFLYYDVIDISTIKSISESTNPVSAPATSLDRLEITYGRFASVMISPERKKEFIQDIVSLNPNVEVKLKPGK